MTWGQWLLTAYALKEREEEDAERQLNALKGQAEMLKSVLGLRFTSIPDKDTGRVPFIPLTAILGDPHVMQGLFERAAQERQAMTDEGFEETSQALLKDAQEGYIPADLLEDLTMTDLERRQRGFDRSAARSHVPFDDDTVVGPTAALPAAAVESTTPAPAPVLEAAVTPLSPTRRRKRNG